MQGVGKVVNTLIESIVRNESNVNKETYNIIKVVDYNIKIDINQNVENAVESENDTEKLEDIVMRMLSKLRMLRSH